MERLDGEARDGNSAIEKETEYRIDYPYVEPLKCRPCSITMRKPPSFLRHGDLLKHLKLRHSILNMTFRCHRCQEPFPTVKATKTHQARHSNCHSIRSMDNDDIIVEPDDRLPSLYHEYVVDVPEIPSTFTCRLCHNESRVFDSTKAFVPHLRAHLHRLMFRCMQCDQKLDNLTIAKKHLAKCGQSQHLTEHGSPDRVTVTTETTITIGPAVTSTENTATMRSAHDTNQQHPMAITVAPVPTVVTGQKHTSVVLRGTPCSTDQKRWIDKLMSTLTPKELEEAISELIEIARKENEGPNTKTNPTIQAQRRSTQPRPRRFDARAASRLQKLYRKNRPRTLREITNAESPFCQIPSSDLHNHFTEVFGPSPPTNKGMPATVPTHKDAISPNENDPFITEFKPEEVWRRLQKCRNTAPGPDSIRYSTWRKLDPGAHILAAAFNAAHRLEYIPAPWSESKTILLHKKGPKEDISNWRPISLGNTIAKIYASTLAARLGEWAMRHGRISRAQKGFMAVDGCAEHNFLLQSAIKQARRNRTRIGIAWLDLTNAFGSVPHETLFHALNYAGLNDKAVGIIRRLYTNCVTTIRSNTGPTPCITIRAGVKQGCPLSPIVFNLALEPLIRAISHLNKGLHVHGRPIDVLAYADDLAIVTDDFDSLQLMLNTVTEVAEWAGLKFNAKKCATLCIDGKNHEAAPIEFTVQKEKLVVMNESDHYEHLGVPTGYHNTASAEKALEKMTNQLEAIHKSLLAPWQKADAVNTFILPSIGFHLKNGIVPKKQLSIFDKTLKRAAKKWMNLPNRASIEPIYLDNSTGGLGLQPTNTLADVAQIIHGFRLLESKDLGKLSMRLVKEVTEKRLRRTIHSETELADYLNGSLEGDFRNESSDISSTWTRLRQATKRLQKFMGVKWRWSQDHLELTLNGSPLSPKNSESQLRRAIREYHRRLLLAKPDQGKAFAVTAANSCSNHFLREGRFTRFADWRFIHRARLNTVTLNATQHWKQVDRRCRRCGHPLETLPHVLCHCNPNMVAITQRHNGILDRLLRAFKPPASTEIRINQRVPELNQNLRPDLLAIDETKKTVMVIDVTMPFENRVNAFEDARFQKKAKYEPVVRHYTQKGYEVSLEAFIVGPLGGWDPTNEAVLRKMGISSRYASLMKKLMCSDAIRWSRDIYVEHLSGNRQWTNDQSERLTRRQRTTPNQQSF